MVLSFPVYCELGILNGMFEPFNAISNFFYIVVGILLWRHFKKNNIDDSISKWFVVSVILVGVGSLLWHAYRSLLTNLLDVIPVALLILSILYIYSRDAFKTRDKFYWFLGTGFIVLLVVEFFVSPYLPAYLQNGGYGYATILLLFLIPIFQYKNRSRTFFNKSLVVLGLFFIALIFRQIDIIVCDSLSIGTHFLWHLFAALAVYKVIKLIYLNKQYL